MPASARLAAVSAVAASLFATTLPARSADLYEPPRYGSTYDDQRYGDGYRDEGSADERYGEAEEELETPYQRRGPYSNDDAFDRRYAGEQGCVPHAIADQRLRDDGWHDFHAFEPRERVVIVQARRPSGRLFDLTIDRCSGEIVSARPLSEGRSYAGAPRRYWQPY